MLRMDILRRALIDLFLLAAAGLLLLLAFEYTDLWQLIVSVFEFTKRHVIAVVTVLLVLIAVGAVGRSPGLYLR